MNHEHHEAALRKFSTAGLIIGFMILLWLPLLDSVLHLDKREALNENRTLAPFPGFKGGTGGMRTFLAGVEGYYNDHFGFRSRLIQWQQNLKRNLFTETMINSAVIGRNGWLYQRYETLFPKVAARRLFSERELADWRALFENRRDWLAKRGIQYAVVIAPGKQTMYPEFLPDWMADTGPAAKSEQFFSFMRSNSTVTLVDLRPALAEAKKRDTIYFLTDAHWNQLGAFMACEEVVRSLQGVVAGAKPLSLDAFEIERKTTVGGNLAQLLLVSKTLMETNCPQLIPRPPLPSLPVVRTDTNRMYLQTCENPAATGRALVFCDSFADGWLPFLGYHFNHVALCRVYLNQEPPAHVWNLTLIEQQRPTIVIDEILDSFLALENAADIRKSDRLP